jgi:hypothetical protein
MNIKNVYVYEILWIFVVNGLKIIVEWDVKLKYNGVGCIVDGNYIPGSIGKAMRAKQ